MNVPELAKKLFFTPWTNIKRQCRKESFKDERGNQMQQTEPYEDIIACEAVSKVNYWTVGQADVQFVFLGLKG